MKGYFSMGEVMSNCSVSEWSSTPQRSGVDKCVKERATLSSFQTIPTSPLRTWSSNFVSSGGFLSRVVTIY